MQAIKAGILEIADIFVVNKADRPDADRAAQHLHLILDLEGGVRRGWSVPVLETVAQTGDGVDALRASIAAHGAHLETSDEGARRARHRAQIALTERVEGLLRAKARATVAAYGGLDGLVDAIEGRTIDPYTAAQTVVDGMDG